MPLTVNNMNPAGMQQQQPQVQQANQANNNAPQELQGARSSGLKTFGRVMLGIFTVGISEGIIALVNYCRRGSDPAPRVVQANVGAPDRNEQAQPVQQVQANPVQQSQGQKTLQFLTNQFNSSNPQLPQEYTDVIQPAYDEIKSDFPDFKGAPKELFYTRNRKLVQEAMQRITQNPNQTITPEQFKQCVKESLIGRIKTEGLASKINESCQQAGVAMDGPTSKNLANSILRKIQGTDLGRQFEQVKTEQQLQTVLSQCDELIQGKVQIEKKMPEFQQQAFKRATQELSQMTGVDLAECEALLKKSKLPIKFSSLVTEIEKGDFTADQVQAQFEKQASNYVARMKELIDDINKTGLSSDIKTVLFKDLLRGANPLPSEANPYTEIQKLTGSMDVKPLVNAIKSGAPTAEIYEIFITKVVKPLDDHIRAGQSTLSHCWTGSHGKEIMGTDECNTAYKALATMLVGNNPDLRQAVQQRPGVLDELTGQTQIDMTMEHPELTQQQRASRTAHGSGIMYMICNVVRDGQ